MSVEMILRFYKDYKTLKCCKCLKEHDIDNILLVPVIVDFMDRDTLEYHHYCYECFYNDKEKK